MVIEGRKLLRYELVGFARAGFVVRSRGISSLGALATVHFTVFVAPKGNMAHAWVFVKEKIWSHGCGDGILKSGREESIFLGSCENTGLGIQRASVRERDCRIHYIRGMRMETREVYLNIISGRYRGL